MPKYEVPPQELLDKSEALQKNLTSHGATVELYLSSGDFGDDWRFRLVSDYISDPEKRVITNHLNPDTADWHTYMLFVHAFYNAYSDGIYKGKMIAITHQMGALCNDLTVSQRDHLKYLNNGEEEMKLKTFLQQTQRVRN